MKYRIVREDGLVIASGINDILGAFFDAATLKQNTGKQYRVAEDVGETIRINAR